MSPLHKTTSNPSIQALYRKALEAGLVDSSDTSVVFYDFSIMEDRLQRIKTSFPAASLHAIPVKTNPLSFVLKEIVDQGFGLEAASFEEVQLGLNAGIAREKLVFDSPAKTRAEIAELVRLGQFRVNANSIEELARYPKHSSQLRLGLRINPSSISESVSSMNVSGRYSKFGESIDGRAEITSAFQEWEDLDTLHVHIGSQSENFDPTVEAIKEIYDLATEINQACGNKKVRALDIGGGFPVNYGVEDAYLIEAFADRLNARIPQLKNEEFELVTEFGRYVHANAAWVVTNIEYVKPHSGGKTITCHVGADFFLREAYDSTAWHHDMFVMDDQGNERKGPSSKTAVGGPLCFGGDFVEVDVDLPDVVQGDKLVIRDVGANTFALWSRHCSRSFPKVLACSADTRELTIGKQREPMAALISFWS